MHHPVAGRLELPYENLDLPADPDLSMMTYNPEPGTAASDALRLLQSWNAEREPAVRPGSSGDAFPVQEDTAPRTS